MASPPATPFEHVRPDSQLVGRTWTQCDRSVQSELGGVSYSLGSALGYFFRGEEFTIQGSSLTLRRSRVMRDGLWLTLVTH